MYEYGGIYADLDYYCYSNFYEDLKDEVYLVENPLGNDPIENSLMCSAPKHNFWIECMELTKKRYEHVKLKFPERLSYLKEICENEKYGLLIRPHLVFYITGTNHLSSAARMTKENVSTLPGILYNNNDISYHAAYKTRHIHTGIWGKETIGVFEKNELHQNTLRNISIKDFDFYTDYSNGQFLKQNDIDFNKNEADEGLSLNAKYEFS
jgi:hypothetical protein